MDLRFERRVLARFDEIVELPAGERATRLNAEEDARIRDAVRALLTEDDKTELVATRPPEGPGEPAPPLPEAVGPWRLEAKIGEGGMGSVWRASRADGLFDQSVAVKFIRPEILSGRSREYFDRERRILGKLRHPAIARILDAGADEGGHGWLVMDLVSGRPITEALAGSDLVARLACFRQAAEAVAFAHRNLIVHADIKPANILVEEDGSIRLLDFGIARIVDPAGEAAAAGAIEPMTRSHAAPERLAGGPPTVASDVYALGAVLFELLTGRLPERSGEAETRLEPDGPPVPVVAILWPKASEAARDPLIPAARLKCDLDAIVARATAADPTRRYPDVGTLLNDLDLYARGRPVSALAGDRRHAARRFVARNRRPIAIGAVVAALLILATVVSVLASIRADRQRGEAEARFAELRGLSRYILFDTIDSLERVPGSGPVRASLAAASQRYLEGLSLTRDAPIDVALEAGEAQLRLATITGVPGMGGIGEGARAPALIERAEAILADVVRRDPDNAPAMAELAWASLSRWPLAGPNEGGAHIVRARQWLARARAIDPANQRARLGALAAQRAEAYDLVWASEFARAERAARAGLDSLSGQRFSGRSLIDARIIAAQLMLRLGDATFYQDRKQEALAWYRRARDQIRFAIRRHGDMPRLLAALGETHWNVGSTIGDMPGGMTRALGEMNTAIPLLERVLSYGPDERADQLLSILLNQRGAYLLDLDRPREALADFERSLAMREAAARATPGNVTLRRAIAIQLHTLTETHLALGDAPAACLAARRAITIWRAIERGGELTALDRSDEYPEMRALHARACGV